MKLRLSPYDGNGYGPVSPDDCDYDEDEPEPWRALDDREPPDDEDREPCL